MSDDVQTSATIASLRAEVERLTAELQGEREDLATARERAGVLEAECNLYRKYQASVDTCDCGSDGCDKCDDAYGDWQAARKKTDRTNALDAAKFGGG